MQTQDLESLLELVAQGWAVFPCHSIIDGQCTCGKGNCKSQGKHPRTVNGVKDASTDPAVIKQWDKTWPGANWALATGVASGVVVIDIDRKSGGFESAEEMDRNVPNAFIDTLRVLTGGGGRHLYYSCPPNSDYKNKVGWMPGIDVRANGGYVLLPPSNHLSGGTYRWEASARPISPITVELHDALQAPSSKAEGGMDLSDLATILKGLPEGQRDDTLFKLACRLRRQHEGDKDEGRAFIETIIFSAADAANFSRAEAAKCIDSAFKQDHAKPAEVLSEEGFFPLDEQGCADRFIKAFGDDLRFSPAIGWLMWSDRGWQPMEDYMLRANLMAVGDVLLEEVNSMAYLDKTLRSKYEACYSRVRSSAGNKALQALVEQSPKIVRQMEDFDSNPEELACENGIVDLRTGILRPYSRNDLVTKNTRVKYSPTAKSQTWEDFLGVSTQGDAELIQYLQLAAGYTATGMMDDESFFVISGPRASGKSSYMGAIQKVLGDYSITVPAHVFMRRRGQVPETDLARMAGARMVSIAEINEGDYFNESLTKQVTSGDRTTARHLYKRAFDFFPQFKLWIATNHEPMSSDPALMRRLKRIEFTHSIPKADRDPRVKAELTSTAAEAVLAWVVEGAKQYLNSLDGKIEEPLSILAAGADYEESQDILGMFLNEALHPQEGMDESIMGIYHVYAVWCKELNIKSAALPVFTKQLTDRGYRVRRETATRRVVEGVALMVVNSGDRQWA